MDKFDQIRYPVTWRYRTVKKMNKTIWTALLLAFALILSASSVQAVTIGDLFGWLAGDEDSSDSSDDREKDSGKTQDAEDTADDDYYMSLDVSEDGEYDTKDEVCAYLVQYHELPSNYMTKKEARKKGWEGGALNRLIDGMCIGFFLVQGYAWMHRPYNYSRSVNIYLCYNHISILNTIVGLQYIWI